jgi:hypothetical protein
MKTDRERRGRTWQRWPRISDEVWPVTSCMSGRRGSDSPSTASGAVRCSAHSQSSRFFARWKLHPRLDTPGIADTTQDCSVAPAAQIEDLSRVSTIRRCSGQLPASPVTASYDRGTPSWVGGPQGPSLHPWQRASSSCPPSYRRTGSCLCAGLHSPASSFLLVGSSVGRDGVAPLPRTTPLQRQSPRLTRPTRRRPYSLERFTRDQDRGGQGTIAKPVLNLRVVHDT